MTDEHYQKLRDGTAQLFQKNPLVHCPYFNQEVTLNADGLHHLRYSAGRERSKAEQALKFSLVPLALKVIRKSGTLQEYRKGLIEVGKQSARDGSIPMKHVEYWGFVAIMGDENPVKLRAVLRRIGDGKIIFWSVMPAMKLSRDGAARRQGLASRGLEDD